MSRLFLLFCLVSIVSATLSYDVRYARVRSAETSKCLPRVAMQFINATLPVLASDDSIMNDTVYVARLGRFAIVLTQTMASGNDFCTAFGRTCTRMVVEWTHRFYPQSEATYTSHCRNVLGASEDADLFLTRYPTFENELYLCLRVGMKVPSEVPWFN